LIRHLAPIVSEGFKVPQAGQGGVCKADEAAEPVWGNCRA